MKKVYNLTIRSIFAGMMIGIGGLIYTRCSNAVVGSFLFSFGLLAILNFDGLLYTGKIGYFKFEKDSIWQYPLMLIMNALGVFIVSLLTKNTDNQIFINKLDNSLYNVFLSSLLCGIMMYLAVELYRRNSNPLYVIMAIMIFILGKFDHCIANMYFFAINPIPSLSMDTIWFFIVNILGNSLGPVGIRILTKNS